MDEQRHVARELDVDKGSRFERGPPARAAGAGDQADGECRGETGEREQQGQRQAMQEDAAIAPDDRPVERVLHLSPGAFAASLSSFGPDLDRRSGST